MLQLKEIKKDYVTAGVTVQALKGVSLEFRNNEFVSILGASGCGKTTLLNIIGGLDHYTSGDLIIRGKSTKDYNDKDWDVYRNHRIGFVFQSYNLIPHQTVLENVELALTIAGIDSEERKARAVEALEKVGLKDHLNKRPNQLSGGQMQRVAIARALVNNPEILLADEPTGALDSTTSVQIMDLIREIAGERLVIMVTHNPELAEQYSTRIVRLADGNVVSDTNPYDSSKDENKPVLDTPVKEKKAKKQKGEKASMSFWTSLGLSFRNLLTKKGRTALTSFAGSIGIISVCLVLALSNGFNNYIIKTEEDMLSNYPVQVTQTSFDMTTIMSGMSTVREIPTREQLGDKVYVNSFITQMANGMTVKNNISDAYVSYIEEKISDYCYAIQYDYGQDLSKNLFTGTTVNWNNDGETLEVKNMSLSKIKDYYTLKLQNSSKPEIATLAPMVAYLGDVYNVMPGTRNLQDETSFKYVQSQYDLVSGSWPTQENQAVFVIRQQDYLTDLAFAQLGFVDEFTFMDYFYTSEESKEQIDADNNGIPDSKERDFNEILNKKYTLFYNDFIFDGLSDTDIFAGKTNDMADNLTATEEQGINIQISAIVRLKDDLNYGCLSDGLNLTESVIDTYIKKNQTSAINEKLRSLPAGYAETLLRKYGCIGLDDPDGYIAYSMVSMYPKDFDAKEKMMAVLDEWNDTCVNGGSYTYVDRNGVEQTVTLSLEDKINYTDTVGLMMGMVQTMLNAITYVLVSFTAISLVVSSVMIGIITYVSVVERTKEIGVLRALGASKRNVKNLFNAETFLIGLASGLLGVVIAYTLCLLINAILTPLTGIAGLASLRIFDAIVMIIISITLTLISGLIPAKSAAKKDPVIALRTE